jgi:ABC-type lipoprotein release transport system permease subunit
MTITLVCVTVAVSGLYSIVSLLCQKRRKEIAIRKINGARMNDILMIFLKEYIPIILMSAIAAFSVGTVIMHRWLTTYIRQTPMTVWVYLSVLLSMLIIIGLTVFGNIRRAMMENPADVIKSE